MTDHLRITTSDGIELVADTYGDGSAHPVVLLHGGGQTRHSWGTSARRFGERGRYALTFDLRGHGDSGWSPDGNYDIERFAGDILTICEAMPSPPALVGASLGGVASLLAVGEAPDAIASALVLVDVAPNIEPKGVQRIRDFMAKGLGGFASLEDAADAIAAYNPHRPRPASVDGLKKNLRQHDDGRWHWHWDPAFMGPRPAQDESEPAGVTGRERPATEGQAAFSDGEAGEGIDGLPQRRFTPRNRLEAAAMNLRLPVLVVRGGSSDLLSEQGVANMLKLVPHARRGDVAGAGHMVAGDRNDAFNDAVTEFLDDVVPVGAAGPYPQ